LPSSSRVRSEVGAELGVTGAALYRHFPSKDALLVELIERVCDRVTGEASETVSAGGGDRRVLAGLIAGQLRMVLDDRDVVIVWTHELSSLPREDWRRMRRKQRMYLEEWLHVLVGLRPDLSEAEARSLVHAAIGVLHSSVQHESGLTRDAQEALLVAAVYRILGVAAND